METSTTITARQPWNKGKLVGQKTPLKLKEIWAIRIRLQIASRCRDLALFNLAVDSKLRACDLMQLRVRDVCHGQSMASRALILQQLNASSESLHSGQSSTGAGSRNYWSIRWIILRCLGRWALCTTRLS